MNTSEAAFAASQLFIMPWQALKCFFEWHRGIEWGTVSL
jgi:hypothetical protein